MEHDPPKVEDVGSSPIVVAKFDARKARGPPFNGRLETAVPAAAKAVRAALDDEPDKRAGAALKTDGRREALRCKPAVIPPLGQ